ASFVVLGAWLARRRRLPALRSVLATCFALVVVSGCGSKGGGSGPSGGNPDGGSLSCGTGQTSCASGCVDLTSSDQNCGACGRACTSGFACVGASCAFSTDNPFVRTVTPPAFGGSPSPALEITGQGFKPGAIVRVSGIGATQEKPLDVVSATSARLAAGGIDLTGAALGTGELRVLNPGRYVSNAVPLSLVEALRVGSVVPASLRQDATTAQSMQLLGVGFVQGATVSLVVNGVEQQLTPVYKGPGEIDVTLPPPSGLPIGQHQLRVVNPGGAAASPAAFSITEGTPVVAAVDVGPSSPCVVASATFSGSLTGSYLYPTSVVRVSGGSIVDSPLTTSCLFGTDALGQCVNGKLRVAADLSQVSGPFAVTVWNPGSPSPLTGAAPAPISVQLSCP
ncbi:MAG TPA: hypothetical protein VFP65_09415, partial [Anaeromyxobacteraceae bacterium]|nr:hypothetical protein [Anaeromyxobacteraceae bacterium]